MAFFYIKCNIYFLQYLFHYIFMSYFLSGCSGVYHIHLIKPYVRLIELNFSEEYKHYFYTYLFSLPIFCTIVTHSIFTYNTYILLLYITNPIIFCYKYCMSIKEARKKGKKVIFIVCIVIFFFTTSDSLHLLLWIQITFWCHFLTSIQLCSHLLPLC